MLYTTKHLSMQDACNTCPCSYSHADVVDNISRYKEESFNVNSDCLRAIIELFLKLFGFSRVL